MGYGVVKPSLGKTMIYVRWLAGAHFVFGLIYSIASLTVTPENAGMFYQPSAATLLLTMRRTSSTFRNLAPCRYSDRFLCLDSQLPQHDYEGSQRTQADCEGSDVSQTLVVYPLFYHDYIRILFLQLFHLRISF
jgi:hypothetical protein